MFYNYPFEDIYLVEVRRMSLANAHDILLGFNFATLCFRQTRFRTPGVLYSPRIIPNSYRTPHLFGGGKENRTPDPLLAKQVLSQLSYTPNLTAKIS